MVPSWPVLRYLDPKVVLLVDLVGQCQTPLHELETPLALGATASRLRELRAGRSAARSALLALGEGITGIPAGAAGEPQWPAGTCGSLSHTLTHVAALVAQCSQYSSVGIDIDDGRSLGEAAAAEVISPDELELVRRLGLADSEIGAQNFVFSAKEAVFKCQYPVTLSRSLDFLDVRLVEADRDRTLMPQASVAEGRDGAVLEGIRIFNIDIQGVNVIYALLKS